MCSLAFHRRSTLEQHLCGVRVKCNICGESLCSSGVCREFNAHVSEYLMCRTCELTFSEKHELLLHVYVGHLSEEMKTKAEDILQNLRIQTPYSRTVSS